MPVTLMQTADAIFYYPMLMETAKTVRAFCARNGFAYEQYVGIKRGHMPWQATYNRLFLLKEMVERGVEGWVLYLDADALIHDLDFDLGAYLEERSHAAAIFAGYSSCETAYDINAGGFAINLSHPVGRALIQDWYKEIAVISVDDFNKAVHWEHDLANDQHLLWNVLRHYVDDIRMPGRFIFERANHSYVNNGPFISQLLRSMYPSFEERFAALKKRVAEILVDEPAFADEGPGVYLTADHPRWVTSVGRKTDTGIRSTGDAGGLLFGPYIRMDRGRYVAKFYGEVRLAEGQESTGFHYDVSTKRGFLVPAQADCSFTETTKGLLTQLPFELDEDAQEFEIRIGVGPAVDMTIYAVQVVPA